MHCTLQYVHMYVHTYIPVIIADALLLPSPTPNLVNTVTMTTTVPVNTLSGSNGAGNVNKVVELVKFFVTPL